MRLTTRLLTESDDLEHIVNEINRAHWDEANEIEEYEVGALRSYLLQQDTLFAVCYLTETAGPALAGIASARVQHKPYRSIGWLYIDEVDTAASFRHRGVGTALMELLLEFADEQDLDEVWLGTEIDNRAANGLYQSLSPDSVEEMVGYTFERE